MPYARNADGKKGHCYNFWREHAFIIKGKVAPSGVTQEAPDWYVGIVS
jgi:hypothetical protein